MKSTSPVIGPAVALSLLLVNPIRVGAQDAWCARTQCLVAGTPVFDAPFSAEATTEWHPVTGTGRSEMRATARYYRDSAGRVRVEQGTAGSHRGGQRIIVIPDPASGSAYLLDPTRRTSTTISRGLAQMMVGGGGRDLFVLPLSSNRFAAFFQSPGDGVTSRDPTDEEPLGERSIAGVHTTGVGFTTLLPTGVSGRGLGERWVSPDLKLLVYGRSEDWHFGRFEYRLDHISRAEPRADLFEVPADYLETPIEGIEPRLTWEYPLNTRPVWP